MTDPAAPPAGRHLHVVTDRANDPGLERLLLGQCLWSHRAIETATTAGVTGATFYDPGHEVTWWALKTLYAQGAPVNATTVAAELERRKALTANDIRRTLRGQTPFQWLAALSQDVPTDGNADWTAEQLLNLQAQRARQELADRLHQLADIGETALYDQELRTHLEDPGTTKDLESTWQPVDLTEFLDGTHTETPPTMLARTDGACLLYPGAVHSIAGEPESGKTWVAILGVVERIQADENVLYIDFEDRPHRITQRLLAAGLSPAQILTQFRYIRPETALDPTTRPHLQQAAQGASLAILDGVTEAMTMHGLELNDNTDVARYLELLPRRLADTGAAVLQIDHVIKDSEKRGRYAIGGQHKLAGIDGCAYKIAVTEPFARGKRGHARISVDKDREGHVRANALGTTIATLTIDSRADEHHDDTQLRIYLDPPTVDYGTDGEFRPTGYMEKISRFLEKSPGTNWRGLAGGVKGKDTHLRAALTALINEGYVRAEPGPNRQTFHHVETPYRADDE